MSDLTQSFNSVLNTIINWIPNVIEFLVVIIIGYFVALFFAWVVRSVLKLAKLEHYLTKSDVGRWAVGVVGRPSKFVGKIVFWVTWFGSFGVAASLANIPLVGDLVSVVYSYVPNVLQALFIFVLAALVSGAVVVVVRRTMGETGTGKVVASVVPVVVMTIATFSILTALEIAPQIVEITYAALVGSVALGFALSFGLGGRDVAGKMLSDAYAAGQRQTEQVRKDFKKGQKQGQKEVENLKKTVKKQANKR